MPMLKMNWLIFAIFEASSDAVYTTYSNIDIKLKIYLYFTSKMVQLFKLFVWLASNGNFNVMYKFDFGLILSN